METVKNTIPRKDDFMCTHIICIGRQYGSGGREVGERLAAALHVPCYDKLLLQRAAQEFHLSEAALAQQDERPANFFQFLSGNTFADMASIAHSFYSGNQMAYEAERAAILKLADQGPCIIIGRCASSILRQRENVRSIFLYADMEDRVHRVMSRNHLEEKDAQKRIRKMDRMRREYFGFYADTVWGQPESYDLMLSTSCYGIDGCVHLILNSLEL